MSTAPLLKHDSPALSRGEIARETVATPPRFEPKTAAMLSAALVLGTFVRFFRLGNRELGIDESVSWVTASAATLRDLVRIQLQADSGKLPVHELVLRLWMKAFGQSEFALRSLPALIGVVSIALVFMVAREMLAFDSARTHAHARDSSSATAALCSLLFALSLPMVDVAREARMYSLMLAMVLTQVAFMFRAGRLGGSRNFVALSLFTALAIAVNFTAALVIVAEVLWLGWLYRARSGDSARRTAWFLAASIFYGGLLLVPFVGGFKNGVVGVQRGDFTWIRPLGRFELITTFESGLGAGPFLLIAPLAAFGAIRMWREAREALIAALLWLAIPTILLYLGSVFFMPMLVTRYMVSSFVPLLFLAAVGIAALRPRSVRMIALLALIALSMLRVAADFRPGKSRWTQAVSFAVAQLGSDRRLGACHDYSLVRYYLPKSAGNLEIVRVDPAALHEPLPRVVVVAPTVAPADFAKVNRAFPRLAGTFNRISVLSRGD